MTRATAPTGTTWSLLQTVFESILEVFILCFAGWVLARRSLLDKKTQKKLNRINVSLFTPALLFSKVAFFLTPHKLRELWIIPFIFVIVTLTSFVIASIISRLFRLKRTQRSFAIAAAMFMNSNSLPIALMQSLVVTVHGLKWGQHDTKDGMLGRALTYLVLHSTLGMMLRWSYGVHLLAQADEETDDGQKALEDEQNDREDGGTTRPIERDYLQPASNANEREPLLKHSKLDYSSTTLLSQRSVSFTNEDSFYYGHANADGEDRVPSRPRTPQSPIPPALRSALRRSQVNANANANTTTSGTDNQLDQPRADTLAVPEGGRPVRPPMVNKQSHFFYSFPNTPTLSRVSLAAPSSPPEDLPLPAATTDNTSSETTTDRLKKFFNTTLPAAWKKSVKSVKEFMTAPMYAALLSLFVACIPPLQHVLDTHMLPVKGAIASAGNCSIPVTLIVLGGYFYREDDGNSGNTADEDGGLKTDLPQQKKTAATAVVSSAVVATAIGTSGTARKRKPIASLGNIGPEDTTDDAQQRTGRSTKDAGLSPPMQRPISDATLVGTSTGRFSRHSRNPSSASQQGNLSSDSNGNGDGLPRFSEALLPPPNGVPTSTATPHSTSAHKGENTTVCVAILARMVFTPLVLLPIMALVAAKTDMRLFDDPVFVVSNVLFISSPPALTLAQITQAASGDAFERLISKTIFWSYCIVTPVTTMIYVFIGLQLSKL